MPGVRANISKSGISASVGAKGATVTFGKRGARANVGIPGTGLSYSTSLGGAAVPSSATKASGSGIKLSAQPAGRKLSGAGWAVAAVLALLGIGKCVSSLPPAGKVTDASETRYVTARALNCRISPTTSATAVRSVKRGEQVTVVETGGDWSRLSGEPTCWVSAAYLSIEPVNLSAPSASLPLMSRTETATPVGRGPSEEATAETIYQDDGGAMAPESVSTRPQTPTYTNDAEICPCSGDQVCIGPRGGRYCITSGGNKRYGV